MKQSIRVIGAGLAGCEAAWQIANAGIRVDLYEMKPQKYTPAHHYQGLAELVCSNSLKAERLDSAAGLLKHEMRLFGSLVMESADETRVPAGGALAVNRTDFSDYITDKIRSHPMITLHEEEVTELAEDGITIIATGPLTSDDLARKIGELVETDRLSFFDAAAPIISEESINSDIVFAASRYDRGDPEDYLNCPMNKEEYERFYQALIEAESAPLKEIDKRDFKVYEGCMPIEVMAKRGPDTLRYGPLKPVGLRDPRTGLRPWAVVQLRKENREGTMYNLVGFQTNLKWGEQKRVFSLIPGLENAEFYRYGVMHRNTFLNSPKILDCYFRMKTKPNFYFAGQMTGVEGYIESAASGIYAGFNAVRQYQGKPLLELPKESMLGALSHYISDESVVDFQPMGANMGVLAPLPEKVHGKKLRYQILAERGLNTMKEALSSINEEETT